MEKLHKLLSTCGLNLSEQEVLLFLLKNGATPGSLLAKRKEIKRTTAYSILQSLEKTGLVIREKSGRSTNFSAVSPKLIVAILKQKAKDYFEEVNKASSDLIFPLTEIAKSSRQVQFGKYTISATESISAISALLNNILIKNDIESIWDVDTVCSIAGGNKILEGFLIETSKNKNKIRDIVVEGENLDWYLKMIDNKNHHVKCIPKKYSLPTDIILSEGVVFQTSYEPNQEMAIQIKHQAYYKTMSQVFEMLWDFLPSKYLLT